VRYSSKSIEKGYRFHLLNITICYLLFDLTICFLVRPYPLLPMQALCSLGELNWVLLGRVGFDITVRIEAVRFEDFCGFHECSNKLLVSHQQKNGNSKPTKKWYRVRQNHSHQ
jgi:hypothetical protein